MIQFPNLPQGPIQNAFNVLNQYLTRLRSVPLDVRNDVASLPKALDFEGKQMRVLDIDGGGTFGIATATNGNWYAYDGSIL